MAQFDCEFCGAGFEQRSRYRRHLMTSHPPQALSAADITAALGQFEFPSGKEQLLNWTKNLGKQELTEVFHRLPDQEYRDAAEVARAFGALRTHEDKPTHQPSKVGGQRAVDAPSAAQLASALRGVEFPATAQQLKEHAEGQAKQERPPWLGHLQSGTYRDMAEVMKGLDQS